MANMVDPLPTNPQVYDISQTNISSSGMSTSAPLGINTMAQFKEMAPKVYDLMMQSAFLTFHSQQEKSNERMKRNRQESER